MLEKLTERQKEICKKILELKGAGTREELANVMKLHYTTIAAHLTDIYSRLLINSRAELVFMLLTHPELLKEGNNENT